MFVVFGPTIFPIGNAQLARRCYLPDREVMTERLKTAPARVKTSAELGRLIRDARKRSQLDQATTADLVGVGPRFLGEVERGKSSARLGLVLKVLERLGLEVWVSPRGWKP